MILKLFFKKLKENPMIFKENAPKAPSRQLISKTDSYLKSDCFYLLLSSKIK